MSADGQDQDAPATPERPRLRGRLIATVKQRPGTTMFVLLAIWAITQLAGGEWVAPAGRLMLAVAGLVFLFYFIAGLVRQEGEELYGGAKYDPKRKHDEGAA